MAKKKGSQSVGRVAERDRPKGRPPSAGGPPTGGPGIEGRRRVAAPVLSALLLLGTGVSIYLVDHHNVVMYGGQSGSALCNVSELFNCDAVNASEWSELLGVPIAAFAVPVYLVSLLMLWWRQSEAAWSRIFALGLASVLYSAALAWVSTAVIGAYCLFCMSLYAVNAGMLGLSWWASGRSFLGNLAHLAPEARRESRTVSALAGAALLLTALAVGAAVDQKRALIAAAAVAAVEETDGGGAPGEVAPLPDSGSPVDASKLGGEAEVRKVRLAGDRQEVPLAATTPTIGPPKAPVTLVLFEDFQCPFCKKLTGNIEAVREKYAGKVRVAFRHFPMHGACNATEIKKDLHPYACGAARAAVCAQEQGRFWELYDLMYRNNTRLKPRDLREHAGRAGLDLARFDACVDSPRSREVVLEDTRVAGALGVTGTPAIFVNGRKLVGAQPVEVLSAVIDAELAGQDRVDFEVALTPETVGPPVKAPPMVRLAGPDGEYAIDTFEASVEGGKAMSVAGVEAARGVSWYQAKAACEAAGKRLCTQQEWMSACAGTLIADGNGNGSVHDEITDAPAFGYGDYHSPGRCADSRKKDDPRPLATGVHPECRTPSGLYDMVGNVKEWVGATPDKAGVVGGSYFSGDAARCFFWRDDVAPDTTTDSALGFRCCSGGEAAPDLDADRHPGGKVGDRLQAFTGTTLDGRTFDSASLRGKTAILTFWASWCAPCRAELPALQEVYRQHRAKGLEVVAINVDRDTEKGRAMAKQLGLDFPLIADPGSDLMGRFDTRGLPTAFWIDRDGVIRSRSVGFDEKKGVAAVLEKLLPML